MKRAIPLVILLACSAAPAFAGPPSGGSNGNLTIGNGNKVIGNGDLTVGAYNHVLGNHDATVGVGNLVHGSYDGTFGNFNTVGTVVGVGHTLY